MFVAVKKPILIVDIDIVGEDEDEEVACECDCELCEDMSISLVASIPGLEVSKGKGLPVAKERRRKVERSKASEKKN